jgi:hypothetical protein
MKALDVVFCLVIHEKKFIISIDRAQKLLGLVGGAPDYTPIPEFIAPESPTRIYAYSPDGGLLAYALPSV